MDFRELVGDDIAGVIDQAWVPTQVQRELIPRILRGADAVATSPTGSGKTLSYLLPIFRAIELMPQQPPDKRVRALVLAPTYDLAAQIHDQARRLWDKIADKTGFTGARPVLLMGGAAIGRQVESLKEKPKIAVGTPGRVLELINIKKLTVHFVKFAVLDEWDRLLDKNNRENVAAVLKAIPKERQTILLSATKPAAAQLSALEGITKNAVHIHADSPDTLQHLTIVCERRDKFAELRKLCRGGSKVLVFVKNAGEAQRVMERLCYHDIQAAALSADMSGAVRKQALSSLRDGKLAVLVATDAAARGIDIPGLDMVVNMEPPQTANEYLHRAGRTGRMGREGLVITLATEGERLRGAFKC